MDGITHLMYHELELPARKLCDGFKGHRRYAVVESEFRRQIGHLQNHNWRGLSVGESLAGLNRIEKDVVVTFDDGSETDLIGAAPILKQANFNATFYVIVGWLGRPGHLSRSQLQELVDMGFEVGCHSMSHATLNELSPTRLRAEIVEAKTRLEDLLGTPVNHFSAPGGVWTRKVAQIARDAGYVSVSTSRPGVNRISTDPFELARVVVMRSTSVRQLERLCKGKGLATRQGREIALQVPKYLLGYTRYARLHSLFEADRPENQPSTRGPDVLATSSSMEKQDRIPAKRPALLIGYNVGDGGSIYEVMVSECLSKAMDLSTHTLDFRKWGHVKYLAAPIEFIGAHRVLKAGNKVIAVKTLSSAFLNPRQQPPSIVIVHHVGASKNLVYSLLEGYILQQARKANAVVVVSEYWERYLLRRGFTNLRKIYNAFKISEFQLTAREIQSFKERYGLLGKPIVYVGKCGRSKGVEESCEALKDLDVHLVASGRAGPERNSLKCLFLARHEYLCLLAASQIAITMSQFAEGWCRTTHEAMLCRTPVIGSGQGGMGELIERGGQIVCRDFRSLRSIVEELLANEDRRSELGRKAYEFARQFTWERFQVEWLDLVTQVCAAPAREASAVPGQVIRNRVSGEGRVSQGS